MESYTNHHLQKLPKIKRFEFVKDVCQMYVDIVLKEAASGKTKCIIIATPSDIKHKQTNEPWTCALTYQEIINYLRSQYPDAKITFDLSQLHINIDWSEIINDTPKW